MDFYSKYSERDKAKNIIDELKLKLAMGDKSLRTVAKEVGIDPSSLSRIINQKQNLPSDDILIELAQALGISQPEYLLIEIGHIPPSRKDLLELLKVASRLHTCDIERVTEYAGHILDRNRLDQAMKDMENKAKSDSESKGIEYE